MAPRTLLVQVRDIIKQIRLDNFTVIFRRVLHNDKSDDGALTNAFRTYLLHQQLIAFVGPPKSRSIVNTNNR